jgi:hypothetical protein
MAVINLESTDAKINKSTAIGRCRKKKVIRNNPYPPSFRSNLAKIIEPLVLASTWALGNQKCNPKMGSFTKKGQNMTNIAKLPVKIKGLTQNPLIFLKKVNRNTRKGMENNTVYSKKYIPADTRSGCLPQNKTISKIGISLNSKET